MIVAELRSMIEEYRKIESRTLASSLRDSDVLRAWCSCCGSRWTKMDVRSRELTWIFSSAVLDRNLNCAADQGSRIIVP